MLQENKARQILREANIFYPLIRTRTWGYHVRNVRFRKMWRSLFTYNTLCEIRPFAALPRNSAATRTILLIRWVLPVRFRLLFPASSLRLVPFPSFFLPKFHLYYLTLLWNPHFIECTAKMYFWFFFRATSCLFSAVEHAYDAIEIQCVDPDKPEFQVGFKFLNQRFSYLFKGFLKETSHKWTSSVYVMRYAIWYHLYNLKTWKTPTEECYF